jgi:riboflavin synthase
MFTGIVEEIGIVKSLQSGRLTISASAMLKGTKQGNSIDVNGACLTVTTISGNTFSIDIMPETLRRTNLGALHPGDGVNLEQRWQRMAVSVGTSFRDTWMARGGSTR